VLTHHKVEWKEGKSEEQFIYSIRKKAIGPFKKDWWDVDLSVRENLGHVLQEQFEFLFEKLNVMKTREFANQVTSLIDQHRARPTSAVEEGDLEIAADLAD
jgi:hypothetical protein